MDPLPLVLTDADRRRLQPLLLFAISECDRVAAVDAAVANGVGPRRWFDVDAERTRANRAARDWAADLLARIGGAA